MLYDETARFAVVIPAYRPSAALLDLLQVLCDKRFPAVVVIDDGSGLEFRDLFARASAFPNVLFTRHAVNLGKGAALRTGIHFALANFPEIAGVVTADADGQHHPEDIARVAAKLLERPDALVLGCRSFGEDVPLRSRFGNIATRGVMHALLGQRLSDTQTGLRGIPLPLIPHLLRLEARGYEFELEMLIAAHRLSVPIVEEPIRTIYEPGNKSSHFNPVIDSMKIYFVLLRFASVSALTAAIDNLIFFLLFHRTGYILLSQVVGRTFAVAFNYSVVRSSVFYSRQRHRAILPKYLALVVASGTASYFGIKAVSSAWGINPVIAKLMVETLLFFVNFAVQRLFIFQPQDGSGIPRRAQDFTFALLVMGTAVVVTAAEVYGFHSEHLFQQEIWTAAGAQRFAGFAGLFAAFSVPLLLIFPWLYAGLAAVMLAGGTVAASGLQAVAAVAFFLISACALGSKILSKPKERQMETHVCATLLGSAIYAFLMTLVARSHINYPAVWAAALAIPILADLRGVWRRLREWGALLRGMELPDWRVRGAFALLLFALTIQWFSVIEPETGVDALAMHLAVPANIAAHHALTFRPNQFLWSVMPMSADFDYAIVYLFGGEAAPSLLNFAFLLAIVALLYTTARRWLTPAVAFLVAALFVSTPLVQLVTGSLFVENFLAAVALGMMAAIWRFGETADRRYLFLAAVLAGAAAAAKFGGWAFALAALPFAAIEIRRKWEFLGRRRVLIAAIAAALFLAVALPPYVIAYRRTGNPFFPFLNRQYPSQLLSRTADFTEQRYRLPVFWSTPYQLTFHTSGFFEGQNGSFGFQNLLLIPLALASLLVLRRRSAVSASIVALAAGAAIMIMEPNARYAYSAMPLLTVSFAALLAWAAANQPWIGKMLIVFAVACTALNAYFDPSSGWLHKDLYSPTVFEADGRARYIRESAPLRDVIRHFRRAHPAAPVLLVEQNDLTDAGDNTHLFQWHENSVRERILNASSAADLRNFFDSLGIRYFVGRRPVPGERPLKPELLRSYLAQCTQEDYRNGRYFAAQTDSTCAGLDGAQLNMKVASDPPDVVATGEYDDFDPAVKFHGAWVRTREFAAPHGRTISYSDVPGSQADFAFDGTAFTYVFTKAPNRGIAEIIVDGATSDVDLYSPAVAWQSREQFCCLGPGVHRVGIRVKGQKQPESQGTFIDLDALIVR